MWPSREPQLGGWQRDADMAHQAGHGTVTLARDDLDELLGGQAVHRAFASATADIQRVGDTALAEQGAGRLAVADGATAEIQQYAGFIDGQLIGSYIAIPDCERYGVAGAARCSLVT